VRDCGAYAELEAGLTPGENVEVVIKRRKEVKRFALKVGRRAE
jgi:hypothetical protein